MGQYIDYFLNYLQTEKDAVKSVISLEKYLIMSSSNCGEAEF